VQFGTAMRGHRPALASLLAWVAMLALLLGTLPLLPHDAADAAAQAWQQPMEGRGGEVPVEEDAPAKLRRCVCTPTKAADKSAGQPVAAQRTGSVSPRPGQRRGASALAAGRTGHALGRCARAPPATRPGTAGGLIFGPA